jgi:hypothetical protein
MRETAKRLNAELVERVYRGKEFTRYITRYITRWYVTIDQDKEIQLTTHQPAK